MGVNVEMHGKNWFERKFHPDGSIYHIFHQVRGMKDKGVTIVVSTENFLGPIVLSTIDGGPWVVEYYMPDGSVRHGDGIKYIEMQ